MLNLYDLVFLQCRLWYLATQLNFQQSNLTCNPRWDAFMQKFPGIWMGVTSSLTHTASKVSIQSQPKGTISSTDCQNELCRYRNGVTFNLNSRKLKIYFNSF